MWKCRDQIVAASRTLAAFRSYLSWRDLLWASGSWNLLLARISFSLSWLMVGFLLWLLFPLSLLAQATTQAAGEAAHGGCIPLSWAGIVLSAMVSTIVYLEHRRAESQKELIRYMERLLEQQANNMNLIGSAISSSIASIKSKQS